MISVFARGSRGKCLNAAHARGDRAFAGERDKTNIAGAAHMGAAAELHRPSHGIAAALSHCDHAHFVPVFLPEQRARPRCNRIIDRHQPGRDRRIQQHGVVGDVLDARHLTLGHRLGMGEIKPQPVGCHKRALLRHMVSQHLT